MKHKFGSTMLYEVVRHLVKKCAIDQYLRQK